MCVCERETSTAVFLVQMIDINQRRSIAFVLRSLVMFSSLYSVSM